MTMDGRKPSSSRARFGRAIQPVGSERRLRIDGRRALRYPDVKRLIMSGYTANVIAHRGVLEDGVDFIQKPFSMNDLAAKVREALDREEGNAS